LNLSNIIIKEYDKQVIGLVKEWTRMRKELLTNFKFVYNSKIE